MRVFRCDGYYQEAMRLHGFLRYGGLMSNRFKHARPFLGIIVLVNGSKFCIPFSSNSHQKRKICFNFPALEKECNKNREIKNKQSMRCK